MSNLIAKKDWTIWYPKKIFIKNQSNDQVHYFFYKKNFFNKKLYSYIDYKIEKQEKKIEIDTINIKNLKEEAYKKGLEEGNQECKKLEVLKKNKIHKIFIDFENSLFACEDLLFKYLLQTVLKVSSYIIGENIKTNEDVLLKHVKHIIQSDNVFLKKPKLIIHPDNKIIVEKFFLKFLNMYGWKLIYDINIEKNSCRVQSESGNLDATMHARWKELCRLIDVGEY